MSKCSGQRIGGEAASSGPASAARRLQDGGTERVPILQGPRRGRVDLERLALLAPFDFADQLGTLDADLMGRPLPLELGSPEAAGGRFEGDLVLGLALRRDHVLGDAMQGGDRGSKAVLQR